MTQAAGPSRTARHRRSTTHPDHFVVAARAKRAAATAAAAMTALFGVVATPNLARAADGTWSGAAGDGGLWQTAGNWSGDIVPGATGTTNNADTATFAGVVSSYAVTVDAGRNVKGLYFDPDPGALTPNLFVVGATPNGGNPLVVSDGGAIETSQFNPTTPPNVAVTNDINAPVLLAGPTYSFINNAGDAVNTLGALRFFGNISPGATSSVLTLAGDHGASGSCRAEIMGALTDGTGGATLSVVKQGVGVWEVNADSANPNTYSGDTIINGGILRSSSGTGTNGLGGFSANSHYIVNGPVAGDTTTNTGGTLRNSVVGTTIKKLTVNFGGQITASTAASTLLNVKSESGAAITLNLAANTHSNAISYSIPFALTGTTADQGGVTLLASSGPTGTGAVSFGSSTGFFDTGAVRRIFDIAEGADTNADYDLRIQGVIQGSGGFIKTGPGTLRFSGHSAGGLSPMTGTIEIQQGVFNPSGANMFSGAPTLVVNGGTLHLQSGQTQTFGATTVTKGTLTGGNNLVTVAATSFALNVDGADTARVDVIMANGAGGGAADVTKNGTGTATVEISPAYTGTTTVIAGTLSMAASLTSSPTINVTGGTLESRASDTDVLRVIKADNVTISGEARIDLTRNKLITLKPVGTFTAGAYTGVQGDIARAYNFGAWDQPGLTTSEDLADPTSGPLGGTTTLAVNKASEVLFIGDTDTALFAGQTVTGATTLAVYTYAGDVNLDGLVDAADYGVIDNWVQFPGTDGYMNGDFNYDGVIDAADYGIIDNTVQLQGAPIPMNGAAVAGVAGLSGVTAVPEPSAFGAALVAAVGALARRRRRRGGGE